MIASLSGHYELGQRQLASEVESTKASAFEGQLGVIDREEQSGSGSGEASSSEASIEQSEEEEEDEEDEEEEEKELNESRQEIGKTETSDQTDCDTTNVNEEYETEQAAEFAKVESTIEPDYHPEREYFSDPDFHDERPAARRRDRRSQLRATSKSLDVAAPGCESESDESDEEQQDDSERVLSGEGELGANETAATAIENELSLSETDRETVLSVGSHDDERRASREIDETPANQTIDGRELEQTDEQVSCQWTASEACAELFEDDADGTLADDEEERDDLEDDENENTLQGDEQNSAGGSDTGDEGQQEELEEVCEGQQVSRPGGESAGLEEFQEHPEAECSAVAAITDDHKVPGIKDRENEETKSKQDLSPDISFRASHCDTEIEYDTRLMTLVSEYCRELVELTLKEALNEAERSFNSSLEAGAQAASPIESFPRIETEADRPEMIEQEQLKAQTNLIETKRIYTSSLFYDDAADSYPTIDTQIDRCQTIAKQLEFGCCSNESLDKSEAKMQQQQHQKGGESVGIRSEPVNEKASVMFKRRRERMRHYTICSPYCLADTDTIISPTLENKRARLRRCNSEPPIMNCPQQVTGGRRDRVYAPSSPDSSSSGSLTDTEYEAPLVGRRRHSHLTAGGDKSQTGCIDIDSTHQQQQQAACTRNKYKPFLDSTTLKDIERLREWCPRQTYNEHQSVTPEICKRLVEDLTQGGVSEPAAAAAARRTKSRGAILFEQRQLQSSDWIVGGLENERERSIENQKLCAPIDSRADDQPTARVRVVIVEPPQIERREEHVNATTLTGRLSRPSIGEETVMVAEQGCGVATEQAELIELTPLVMSHQQPRLELATITRTPSFSASSRHILDERDNLPSLSHYSSSLGTSDDDDNDDNDNEFTPFDDTQLAVPVGQRTTSEVLGPTTVETTDEHHAYLDEAAIEHRALVSWSRPKERAGPQRRVFECQRLSLPRMQYASVKYFSHDNECETRIPAIEVTEYQVAEPEVSERQFRSRLPTLRIGGHRPAQAPVRARSETHSDKSARLAVLAKGDAGAGTLRTAGNGGGGKGQQQPVHLRIPMNEQRERQAGVALQVASCARSGAIDDDDERARRILPPMMMTDGNKLESGNVGKKMAQAPQPPPPRVCRCECTCGLPRVAGGQAADGENHADWKWSQQEREQQQQRATATAGALLFHSRPSSDRAGSLRQKDVGGGGVSEPVVPTNQMPTRANDDDTSLACITLGQHALGHWQPRTSLARDWRPLRPRWPHESAHDRPGVPVAPPRAVATAHRAGGGPPASGDDGRVGVTRWQSSGSSAAAMYQTGGYSGGDDFRAGRVLNDESCSWRLAAAISTTPPAVPIGNHSSHAGDNGRTAYQRINEIGKYATTFRGLQAEDSQIRSLRVCVRTPREAHRIVIERRPTMLRHVERQ